MAKSASKCLFLFFLSFLCNSSSGTLVGFSYHANGNTTTSSPSRTISFLKRNKIAPSQIRVFVEDHRILRTISNTGVAIDLYLNEGHLQNIINSRSTSISGLKSYIMPFLSQVKIKSIVATSGDYTRKYALSMLLTTLKSIHSVLSSFPADRGIKVSVAFPLSYLENVSTSHRRDLHRICDYIKQVKSAVIVEAKIDGELSMGERYVHAMIKRASLASSLFPCNDVPIVLTVKSPAVPSATEVAAFADEVSKALENTTHILSSIVGLYAQVSPMEDFAEKEMKRAEEQLFPSSRRELLRNFHLKTTLHEADDSPTIFPTTPISTTPPVSTTPYIPTPTIVTVPSTNPVTIAPLNPMPSTTPITVPSTNPVYSPIPEANPTTAPPITVPGTPVITNPVTTYPAPTGVVPVTTPVTNPVAPPATSTNAPAVPGQSWCVAKTGASQTAVQAGLDYACGKVDCSQLQQGGSCFNPNTLQNHASYAFNSYYQKNPVATSCDFGGVATIVATNPSSGSCTYLSSSSSSTTTPTPTPTTPSPPVSTTPFPPVSTTPTPEPTTPLPASTTPPAPTFTSFPPPGEGVSGSATPPSVLNSSNPASSGTMPQFGMDSPPGFNSSTSSAACLRPFVSYIFLVTALVTKKILLNM
ncbi:PREDICTED: glucan endo-1,3-beta-glucosidase 3-like [Fragaria vesca subsp. vesca]|uniref:glucan endo-1,3-beta-glucosidase 3-like n=1 Tax=Fragaria vesca subsp. vesca TaxID=101020 RepID=UPI0002C2E59C|nr:PREDICTED: glucan endo-1,3-beta-glucosidase 3-like [Fragaria vesca subsp. vesca]